MTQRPVSRTLRPAQVVALRTALEARGLRLAGSPKNPYVAFEVRTDGRSVFTLYTSGKFVSTVREGDAEAQLIEAQVAALVGEAPGRPRALAAPRAERATRWLGGLDETGTGELLGRAVIGGALVPAPLVDELAALAGHVDTKAGRAASGWEALGEALVGLTPRGLRLACLPLPNRLFDAWSKNALLDLGYVRNVGNLLAAAGLREDLSGVELIIDDYGAGAALAEGVAAWRAAGARVLVQTKADDTFLAPRAAAVLARAARAREFSGFSAESEDGPLGTGNAGNPATLRWLAARVRGGRPLPSFVKRSFRTVTELLGTGEARKLKPPPLSHLLDERGAETARSGRLDVASAALRAPDGSLHRGLDVDAAGRRPPSQAPLPAFELLAVLCGGLVLDPSVEARLPELLARETGLLSGWRVLVGPQAGGDRGTLLDLARAHRAGTILVERTEVDDPLERARRHDAVLVTAARRAPGQLHLRLR